MIYIRIVRIAEDERTATYEFGPNEDRVGQMRTDILSGATEVLTEVPDDDSYAYSSPTAYKLTKHWREGKLPGGTVYAA